MDFGLWAGLVIREWKALMGEKISFLSINTVQFPCHQRTDRNLPEVKEDAVDAAKQAGALASDWRQPRNHEEKLSNRLRHLYLGPLSLRIIHQRQAKAEEKSRGRERETRREAELATHRAARGRQVSAHSPSSAAAAAAKSGRRTPRKPGQGNDQRAEECGYQAWWSVLI